MEDKQGKEKLKEKLAAAVRSIQWSYAIFWCSSSTQPGVLEWGEGYYNGGIKTGRTILSCMEIKGNNDQRVSQRSDQLRELYQSLLSASTTQTRRPLAALAPEDLTNVEWFLLGLHSFCLQFWPRVAWKMSSKWSNYMAFECPSR